MFLSCSGVAMILQGQHGEAITADWRAENLKSAQVVLQSRSFGQPDIQDVVHLIFTSSPICETTLN